MNDLLRYPLRPGSRLLALLAVALVGLAGLPGLASAQDEGSEPLAYVAADLYPMLPASGVYYDHGRGGTGLTIDFDASGYVFAVFYSYTESGGQAYYLMQGNYVPSTEDELYSTGVMGRFEAEPYLSVNGECVGESCTYKSPDAVTTGLSASIVWTTARRATITIGSQSWDVQKGLTVPEEDLLVGTWSMVVTGQAENWPHPVVSSGVVRIEEAPGITASMFESTHDATIPPAGSLLYELSCVSGAPASDDTGNSTYQSCHWLLLHLRAQIDRDGDGMGDPPEWPLHTFLFYDSATGRAGLVSAQDVFGTLVVGDIMSTIGFDSPYYDTGSIYSELHVNGGVIRGRAYNEWQEGTPHLFGDVVLTRLVDGTLRFRRDGDEDVYPIQPVQ